MTLCGGGIAIFDNHRLQQVERPNCYNQEHMNSTTSKLFVGQNVDLI